MIRRLNWPLWLGLLLSIAAFLSYFFLFARYPLTRDVPWASLLLFGAAILFLVRGARRAFSPPSSALRKSVASIVAAVGLGIAAFFLIIVTVGTKMLPAAHGAPAVGAIAPDFTLVDTNGRPVTMSQVLGTPATNGVLLIFYRGYW